jgi:chromosome segregation ATPase
MSDAPEDAVEGTDQERRDAIRRAWLTEHGGEAVRLEAAVVAEIAYRLVEAGLQPTVDAIRYVNGGQGSPNVIHPAVRQFFRAELRRRWGATPPPDVPGVPPALVELWGQCVRDAQRAADSTLETPRAELARLRVAVEQRSAEVETLAEHQRAELTAIKEQAADLAKRLDRSEKAQADAVEHARAAATALVKAQAEARAQHEAHKVSQAQASAERAGLANDLDRWRAQAEEARRDVAEMARARDAVMHRLADQGDRERELRTTLANATIQVETLRDEVRQAALRWTAEVAARQAASDAAAHAEQRASLAQDRLQAAEARIQQLQADLDAARTALLGAAHLEGEMQALRDERERLSQWIASMQHTTDPKADGTS